MCRFALESTKRPTHSIDLLKHPVAPQPFIPKHLFAAQFHQTLENRPEIVGDVLRAIPVLIGCETPVNVSAGLQATMEAVDGFDRIHKDARIRPSQ